jgi:hypothetical protein
MKIFARPLHLGTIFAGFPPRKGGDGGFEPYFLGKPSEI